MTGKKRGVLLVGLGAPYYGNLACNLAASIKATSPSIPVCLVHSGDSISHLNEAHKSVFDELIECPVSMYHRKNGKRVFLNKESRRLLEAALAFLRLSPEMLPLVREFKLDEKGKVNVITREDEIRVVMGKWIKKENVRYFKWMLGQLKERSEKPVLVDLSYRGQIIVKNKNTN